MIWHNSTIQQVAEELNTDVNFGLTKAEAEIRLKEYGKNEFKYKNKISIARQLISAFCNLANIAVIVVALINLLLGNTVDADNNHENITIILVVVFSVLIIAALRYVADLMLSKAGSENTSYTNVIRDGQEIAVKSNEIVPGDIMLIKSGDYIKADGRLIDSYALTCDETMVSGDSAPSEKMHDILLDDITQLINRHNMVYSGSFVLNGKGTVIVTDTGLSTEAGMHKDLKKQLEETETPLSSRLTKISKTASTFALISAIIVFFAGVVSDFSNLQFAVTVSSNLLLSICVYISVFSNIIPSILTFSRACAVYRLSHKNIVINSKITSEELKDVTVICTDKTGVLTTEELTVLKVYNGLETVNLSSDQLDDSTAAVLRLALICSNFSHSEHGERHTNNVERSIENACIKLLGMSKVDVDGMYPRISELPFDSDRMLMTTVSSINSNPVSITKGAPEVVFSRCVDLDIEQATVLASSYAKEGLKVIAVAIKELDEIPVNPTQDELEYNMTFVGLIGIEDKISPKAARLCIESAQSGIRTIMVTGDHKDTAIAISKKAGIITDDSQAISGEELAALSDAELATSINNYTVFARILPEDKLRIVAALKYNGEKVLITGDSVNDTPALLDADFGCALGYTASDMVKDSADLVIEDNHYSSIIYAIKESAKIYTNARKSLQHLFTVGISAVMITILGILIFGQTPIPAAALVFHCLFAAILPMCAIFLDRASKEIDSTTKGNKFFDKLSAIRLLIPSFVIVTLSLIAFGICLNSGEAFAFGAVLTVMSFGYTINAICLLSDSSVFSFKLFKHKVGILICMLTLLFLLLIICTPFGSFLSLTGVTSEVWSFSIATVVLILLAQEFIKVYKKFS